ncbi:hypothetical protein AB8U03_10250 [Clostridium sp. Mt-5]|uniref:Uncharacterized protein n=1 Tax=Clostridium moutaii TaxID=3240932 RepID=A0ABV4BSA2_9CLOT
MIFTAAVIVSTLAPVLKTQVVKADEVQAIRIGRAVENGILIKNGSKLEQACKIDTVVFDKTGTLTTGKSEITYDYRR